MTVRRPFYEGETIDLLVPTRDDVENSTWLDWFNSQQTNRYTQHALFPNTLEKQLAFFDTLQTEERISLLIAAKRDQRFIGTVSLSGINFRTSSAAIAIVMDTEAAPGASPLASLEAIALLTQHAFDALGLKRVNSGQVYPALAKWNQILEILGYRTEGFHRQAFIRGQEVSDEVIMACLLSNYSRLLQTRAGNLWPGTERARMLIRELPKRSFASILDESHRALEKDYFGNS